MKKIYFFYEYRDSRGQGSEKIFETKEEAIEYAKNEWNRLANRDKKSYKDSDQFGAFEGNLIWNEDEEDYVIDYSNYNVVWSAI